MVLCSSAIRPAVVEMSSSSAKFLFLDLPREVRDVIYSYLLVADGRIYLVDQLTTSTHRKFRSKIELDSSAWIRGFKGDAGALDPRILAVSRQSRDEALPILYCKNVFNITFSNAEQFDRKFEAANIILPTIMETPGFVRLIGSSNAALLQNVNLATSMSWDTSDLCMRWITNFFSPLKTVRHLAIVISYGTSFEQNRSRREVFEAVSKECVQLARALPDRIGTRANGSDASHSKTSATFNCHMFQRTSRC